MNTQNSKKKLNTKSAREAAGLEWARSEDRYAYFRVCYGDAISVSTALFRTRDDALSYINSVCENYVVEGLTPPNLYVVGVCRGDR